MAEVKLKEEQELWEPAEEDNRRIKEEPDCGGVQSPHEAAPSLLQIKEEPEEDQIKQESIQVFPVIVSVRSEKEESLLHETVKEENRGDRDGAEAENSSDTDDYLSEDGGPDKPHKCPECKKGFSTRYNLKKHLQTSAGEKPFRCPTCEKGFSQKSQLKRHMLTHTGEKAFRCSVCAKTFSQNSHLKRHMRHHTEENPFRCSVCAMTFSRNGDLKRHMRNHAEDQTVK